MACFCCNTTENFIFLLKYRQGKVDLNTSKKSLVFVTIRHKIYLRAAVVYENFIFTQKYAFAERCCFLTFSFEGKLRKYDISVKRKNTKTNENMIFSALFTNFRKTKILFFMHCNIFLILDKTSSPIRFMVVFIFLNSFWVTFYSIQIFLTVAF